jgi:signal transduction histidine kinase
MAEYSTTPKAQETLAALWRLSKLILDTLDFREVVQKIVESTLTELGYLNLGYRVIILALIDEKTQTLKRISFSRTKEGMEAIGSLSLPFEQISIPLHEENNLCIKVIQQKQPLITHSVADVFYPALKKEEILPIQQAVGIKTTMVYPVQAKGKPLGVLIFSLIKSEEEVSQEEKDLLAGFTDIVGLAVQDAQLYSSLQEANERLKSLDKLKDEFVSLASHELRSPLTAIKSYLWYVTSGRSGPLTESQKMHLERVYKSSERLIHLVNDMLSVSRIESGRLSIVMKPTDLVALANDVITDMLPTAQAQNVSLVLMQPPAPLGPVQADADRTKEVFINLIGNALKFTPAGGTITISLEQQDDMILTHVTDTGKGIKPEDMKGLFQKFGMVEGNYYTRNLTQGTGLGLYISKSIVEMQGGKMTVFSEGENKGATFTFSLKKAVDTTLSEQKPPETSGEIGASGPSSAQLNPQA